MVILHLVQRDLHNAVDIITFSLELSNGDELHYMWCLGQISVKLPPAALNQRVIAPWRRGGGDAHIGWRPINPPYYKL